MDRHTTPTTNDAGTSPPHPRGFQRAGRFETYEQGLAWWENYQMENLQELEAWINSPFYKTAPRIVKIHALIERGRLMKGLGIKDVKGE